MRIAWGISPVSELGIKFDEVNEADAFPIFFLGLADCLVHAFFVGGGMDGLSDADAVEDVIDLADGGNH